jgi:EAL and modified HD-GYP domain-containing signal transduction protein
MDSTTTPAPKADDAAPGESYAHIARQPILDRQQHIVGYELLARESATSTQAPAQHTRASDTALLFHALSSISSENLFGDKLAFINVRLEDLGAEHLEIVFPERIVLELPRAAGDDSALIAEAATAMQALRERGFRLAAGVHALTAPYVAWLPLLSYVQIDVQALPAGVLPVLVKRLAAVPKLQLLAEKVETPETFKEYLDAGLHLFQGYYFARPQTVSAKVVNPAYTTVLRLIDLVNKHAEVGAIEDVLKQDPTLSFKLLRYINSSGFGLMTEVTSFRHAVVILGYKKLLRWLVLLLAITPGSSAASSQARVAITRGRMLELLAQQHMSAEDCDNAFVVGVFSMLDAMLGVPLERALQEISLAEPVMQALRDRQGPFGPYLRIVLACEREDWDEIDLHADLLGLSQRAIALAQLEALAWAENLGI